MRKLAAVEEAKAVMREAGEWGVWKWLTEKRRVREAASQAWAALGEAEKKVRAGFSDDLQQAYDDLAAGDSPKAKRRRPANNIDPAVRQAAKRLKDAADEAFRAHMEAEEVFAEAERRMSTSLAREGCGKAILAWELTETAIRKAEAATKEMKA